MSELPRTGRLEPGQPRLELPAPTLPAPRSPGPLESTWRPPFPVHVHATLASLQRGAGDLTQRVDPDGALWRTLPTPCGPATLRLLARGGGVEAAAWGPGAAWALDGVPDLLGARDRPEEFAPTSPVLRQVQRRLAGWRVPRSGLVFDQLVPCVLEQKVTGGQARRSYRELVRRFGSPAPGPAPAGMRVAPGPRVLAHLPSWEWHLAGVELPRQRAIRAAAHVAARLEEASGMPPEQAERRLRAVPGIGAWTAAEIAQRALGDADAVSVGDYHLPALVGWVLLGRPLDDAGMLALLEPHRPHRYRVTRLVELSGIGKPRFAPRQTVQDLRSY